MTTDQPSVTPRLRLLVTKLYIPRLRAPLVQRRRLSAMLAQTAQRKLTVVSAPAGFGKTTLLSAWAAESGVPLAWLSLDAGDNDPTRFWAYIVSALQTIQAGVGEDVLSLLRSPQPPPIEPLLTSLINDLSAIDGSFVLVLDDYHAITTSSIHDGMSFLIERLPPQMHVVLASRAAPPLPLALLRARGELVEIGAPDLRFTPEEGATFLGQVMGLRLAPEDIAALDKRTEGWIAGLQLAALSMQGMEDSASFVRSFSGSHRYVLDYLAQEILARQPEAVRAFLLRTSILERLSGRLCDAVTGADDGQKMLERLEQANLFTVPLDGERHWYRYHHLFAGFLRAQLEETGPAAGDLHQRASDWFAQHGFAAEAIEHALLTSDNDLAARRIEELCSALFDNSELITLRGWLERLPDEVIFARPRLSAICAWTMLATGRTDLVEQYLQAIERSSLGSDRGARGEVATMRSALAAGTMDTEAAVRYGKEALGELQTAQRGVWNTVIPLRGAASFGLAIGYELMGRVVESSAAFAESAALNQQAANFHLVPLSLSRLAQAQMLQGQLRLAAQTYRQALQRTAEMSARPSPLSGQAYTGLGAILYEWNDLDAAAQHLQMGIDLGRQWHIWDAVFAGGSIMARIHAARGDMSAAMADLDELLPMAPPPPLLDYVRSTIDALRASLWVGAGDLDAATRWHESCDLDATASPDYVQESIYLIAARVCIALGQDILPLIERLQHSTESGGRTGRLIEVLALKALALHAQGRTAAASGALEQALALAGAEGYVRTFVDLGAPMARLIQSVTSPAVAAYVQKLSVAFERPRRPLALSSPPEALSAREKDVIALLARGLSNEQIAGKLVVSPNTVKTHVKNIFQKLGVSSRTQAIARARELGLV